jgi:hypothetical protein
MTNTRRNRKSRRANGLFGFAAGVVNPLVNTGSKGVGRIANTGKGLVNTTAKGVTGLTSNVASGLNKAVSGLFSPLMNKGRRTRRNRRANRKSRRNNRRTNH